MVESDRLLQSKVLGPQTLEHNPASYFFEYEKLTRNMCK